MREKVRERERELELRVELYGWEVCQGMLE